MTDPVTPDPTPAAPAYAPGAVAPKTNVIAIVALVASFFISLLGIILGFVALSQIKRTGEGGRGLAIAGIIIGFVAIGLTILFIVLGAVAASMSNNY